MQDVVKFLIDNKSIMDQEAAIQILSSHGKIGECIEYLRVVKKYDKIVFYYIGEQNYSEALKQLGRIRDEDQRNQLMERYCSIFI